jgi:23S rRNA-/tRNA-specific pseudouridylate synthase
MHESIERTTEIAPSDAGKELLSFLVARFTYQDEARWRAHIEAGRLTLNDRHCVGAETLRGGDRVTFRPEPYDEPPVDARYAILAEDDDFLFIDKPAPLPCHPGGIYLYNTLWGLLGETWPGIKFVNRLDRETSGIVVAAKHSEAAARAGALMSGREIDKEYLVLVEGDFPGVIDACGFLEPDEDSPIRKKLRFVGAAEYTRTQESEAGSPAPAENATPGRSACRTLFTPERRFPDGTSLVRAKLFTGRTHQIRATLQSLGYPVVGDKLYGKAPSIFLRFIEGAMTEGDRKLLRLDRQALHCSRIAFPSRAGGMYDIASPAPFREGIPKA